MPAEQVYDENTNPKGVRCTLQDYMVNIFGRATERWERVEKQLGYGFAGRPFDNVGIEYGRKALMTGTITPAQFVDLNDKARRRRHRPTRRTATGSRPTARRSSACTAAAP